MAEIIEEKAEDQETDAGFLGAVRAGEPNSLMTSILLNGQEMSFKMDTGAEVTVISKQAFDDLQGVKLLPASKALYGPTYTPLRALGQFQVTLTKGQETSIQTVYVVDSLRTNLLGLPAITALELISRVDSCGEENIKQRFLSLFRGLGCFGEEYTIKLREGVKPHALFTPWNVPIPLRPKVQEELERMEKLQVISRVTDPTPWCA